MRYPADHKQRTRRRILNAASGLFRTEGFSATGVSAVMKSAGLTVGGFYAHFKSKESLLAASLVHALEEVNLIWFAGLEQREGDAFLRTIVRRYTSRLHRDNVTNGCPLPALLPEIARADDTVRQGFTDYLDRFTKRVATQSGRSQDEVLAWSAMMIGGLLLARAVNDPELSDRILLACRRLVNEAHP